MQAGAFRYSVQRYKIQNSKDMEEMAQLEWLNSSQNKRPWTWKRRSSGIDNGEGKLNDSLVEGKQITVGIGI